MSRDLLLFLAVFVACAVEGVEAVTIVLAAGMTRGWRSAWAGVGAALLVLAAIVAALGPALTALPIDVLRLVVGGLLLVFGLQWLRKAILRAERLQGAARRGGDLRRRSRRLRAAGGREPAASTATASRSASRASCSKASRSRSSSSPSASNQQNVPLAVLPRSPRSWSWSSPGSLPIARCARVPENTLKYVVGVMLTSFGIFWGAEGAGGSWPAGDAAIPAIIVFTLVTSLGLVALLRHRVRPGGLMAPADR